VKDGVENAGEVTKPKHSQDRDQQTTPISTDAGGRRGVGGRGVPLARPKTEIRSATRSTAGSTERGRVAVEGSEGRVHYQGGGYGRDAPGDNPPTVVTDNSATHQVSPNDGKYTWLGPVTRSAVRTSSSSSEFKQVGGAANPDTPQHQDPATQASSAAARTRRGGGGQRLWRAEAVTCVTAAWARGVAVAGRADRSHAGLATDGSARPATDGGGHEKFQRTRSDRDGVVGPRRNGDAGAVRVRAGGQQPTQRPAPAGSPAATSSGNRRRRKARLAQQEPPGLSSPHAGGQYVSRHTRGACGVRGRIGRSVHPSTPWGLTRTRRSDTFPSPTATTTRKSRRLTTRKHPRRYHQKIHGEYHKQHATASTPANDTAITPAKLHGDYHRKCTGVPSGHARRVPPANVIRASTVVHMQGSTIRSVPRRVPHRNPRRLRPPSMHGPFQPGHPWHVQTVHARRYNAGKHGGPSDPALHGEFENRPRVVRHLIHGEIGGCPTY